MDKMDEMRLEKLIDETLSTMDPVKIPDDLHFDAAEIMRRAKREEEAEKPKAAEPVSFSDRLKERTRSRSFTRWAAAAAAFVILLGVYGATRDNGNVPVDPDDGVVIGVDDPVDPELPSGPNVLIPEESYDALFEEALAEEEFAALFSEEDKGHGYRITSAESVSGGVMFHVYFYENEEEYASGLVNEENIRRLLWKTESL